jgi:hypothetical protein
VLLSRSLLIVGGETQNIGSMLQSARTFKLEPVASLEATAVQPTQPDSTQNGASAVIPVVPVVCPSINLTACNPVIFGLPNMNFSK